MVSSRGTNIATFWSEESANGTSEQIAHHRGMKESASNSIQLFGGIQFRLEPISSANMGPVGKLGPQLPSLPEWYPFLQHSVEIASWSLSPRCSRAICWRERVGNTEVVQQLTHRPNMVREFSQPGWDFPSPTGLWKKGEGRKIEFSTRSISVL